MKTQTEFAAPDIPLVAQWILQEEHSTESTNVWVEILAKTLKERLLFPLSKIPSEPSEYFALLLKQPENKQIVDKAQRVLTTSDRTISAQKTAAWLEAMKWLASSPVRLRPLLLPQSLRYVNSDLLQDAAFRAGINIHALLRGELKPPVSWVDVWNPREQLHEANPDRAPLNFLFGLPAEFDLANALIQDRIDNVIALNATKASWMQKQANLLAKQMNIFDPRGRCIHTYVTRQQRGPSLPPLGKASYQELAQSATHLYFSDLFQQKGLSPEWSQAGLYTLRPSLRLRPSPDGKPDPLSVVWENVAYLIPPLLQSGFNSKVRQQLESYSAVGSFNRKRLHLYVCEMLRRFFNDRQENVDAHFPELADCWINAMVSLSKEHLQRLLRPSLVAYLSSFDEERLDQLMEAIHAMFAGGLVDFLAFPALTPKEQKAWLKLRITPIPHYHLLCECLGLSSCFDIPRFWRAYQLTQEAKEKQNAFYRNRATIS